MRRRIDPIVAQLGRSLEVIDHASSIAELIEGAIAAAVKSYVDSRDFAQRRETAEHIGFLTHELRNPLTTAMLGATHLRQALKLSPAQAKTFDGSSARS